MLVVSVYIVLNYVPWHKEAFFDGGVSVVNNG